MRRTVDGETELLECSNISLTERWWREEEDYVDIYDPITCEEYPESDTHSDRYEFNTSDLGLGDTLQILICKTDPYNDNLIELRAYPGESCKEYTCPPIIDCPATFKLRKHLDCVYELPDFTSGIILTDTCQSPDMDVSEEYFIIQNPSPGTIIEDSIFVEITIQDQERITVGQCDIFVTLAGDPSPEIDDPDPINNIIHGDILPDFQLLLAHDTLFDNSIIQLHVETSIDDFSPKPCEGYQITYRWSATNACDNSVTIAQTFEVLPDVNDPIFASVPIDIDTIIAGQPLPILVDLVAVNADGSTTGITMEKSIDPYVMNQCQGYPVTYRWSATDECNNSSELDKTFYVKAVNDPPIFLDAILPIEDIIYGEEMPTPQSVHAMSASGDTASVLVTHSIEPYVENQCEPFEVQYVWTALDSCNNIATASTTFKIIPEEVDFSEMFSTEDINLSLGASCEKEAVLAMPDILSQYDNVGISFTIHDDQWQMIDELNGAEEQAYAFGSGTSYVIYSVMHQCGASFQDTIKVSAADATPPELECLDDITLYVSDFNNCTALTVWSIPQAQDNCSNTSVSQISGPALGSKIPTGHYEVRYEAADDFGNKDTCSFLVDVLPIKGEDFLCKPITVDIDMLCEARINVNKLIEENAIACINDIEASIIINGIDTLKGPEINLQSYSDQLITYEICDQVSGLCCGNTIELKDRTSPVITCADDIFVSCLFTAQEYRPELAVECGTVTWQITEGGTVENCENDTTKATLIRTFYAIDEQGNVSEPCIQHIHILYAQLDQPTTIDKIAFPPDTTLVCDAYDFSSSTNSSSSGIPRVGSIPIEIIKGNSCGISASYVDDILVNRGCTKIVHRKWTLSEPQCHYGVNILTHTQVIKIIDQTPPQINLWKNKYVIGADNSTCKAEFAIPDIDAIDNCDSELEFNIYYDGYWYDTTIPTLTLTVGVNKILIRAKDECNNYGYDTITVDVRDPIMPVAICFENTNVAISASSVLVYAVDLDAGSYDNCSLQKVEIKRSRTTCINDDAIYKDYISFCCEDIGEAVEIFLKATDSSGNTNFCSAMINVVDKLPPTLSIPPNIVVDCKLGIEEKDSEDPYGHIFGTPSIYDNEALDIPTSYILSASGPLLTGVATDNCPENIIIDVKTESKTNKCGIGTIIRRFTAIDAYGNMSKTQEQTIEVVGGMELDTTLIIWPKTDTTIIKCTSITDINPDILGRPYMREEPCALYGMSYEDTYYELSGDTNGACSKMTRKWTVINWCDTNVDMYASKTQIIKLVDEEAPQLDDCSEVIDVYGEGLDCNFINVTIQHRAEDNCTSVNHLIWTAIVNEKTSDRKIIGNITIDTNGWAMANTTLPIGSHDITWLVSDQCGNQSSCIQKIRVDNNKAPTPYATGLTTSISSSSTIEIWASDLLAKAEHPCYNDISISLSRVDNLFEESTSSLLFECEDIGSNYINVYASRILNNGTVIYDYTTVRIDIQDNFGFCSNSNSDDKVDRGVTGSVSTSYGVVLTEATIALKDMFTADIEEVQSDDAGQYAFPNIAEGRPYAINASYKDSKNNGLTTRDVIMIQQHLMGINAYESHWKMLQSDVNQDLKVSSIDIVELRKTIIGQSSEMDKFPAWRFFDAQLTFNPIDYSDLFDLKEGVYIDNMTNNTDGDLIGLKIGDIDHSANLSQNGAKSRSFKKHKLRIENNILKAGEEHEIEVFMDNTFGFGWQFELAYSNDIEIIKVNNPYNDIGITNIQENIIVSSMSLSNAWNISSDKPILIIKLKAHKEISIEESIRLSRTTLTSEFYDSELEVYDLELEYIESTGSVSVSTAIPNPFHTNTSIDVRSPKEQEAHFTISDATGRLVHKNSVPLQLGSNTINFEREDFPNNGLYFIYINIGGHNYTRKLVLTQ